MYHSTTQTLRFSFKPKARPIHSSQALKNKSNTNLPRNPSHPITKDPARFKATTLPCSHLLFINATNPFPL